MRIPVGILAQIIKHMDVVPPLEDVLELRLTSSTVNKEVLRVLARSDQIFPRNVDKLLEINKIELNPQMMVHQMVRCRKRHAASEDHTGLPPPKRRCCFMGHPMNFKIAPEDSVPRPLPLSLLRPYLVARMERAEAHPCLLSVFTDRIWLPRLEHLTKDIFSTLFDSHGLNYWLPLYDATHLTVYPSTEHNIRLFCLFRLIRKSTQLQNYEADEGLPDLIINLLEQPPGASSDNT
ncbi:hypothetical protein BU25DRAFT_424768 [Macroventuria anomochaeta]|uniref:Uncharacterized protein n=1 Tax=Macroventuria anomochaeta TaxID=301207 RepID=A0ACB6RQV9_9PLEO|nr:uncharacterized protein BU25DRAFT_424768 [Macroventuria anomochaeta]KAF2623513.1 hypothetical protein BU25DRAFT_424768 [Macroventuria anomochaeta]